MTFFVFLSIGKNWLKRLFVSCLSVGSASYVNSFITKRLQDAVRTLNCSNFEPIKKTHIEIEYVSSAYIAYMDASLLAGRQSPNTVLEK